jgi:hypothetical protein
MEETLEEFLYEEINRIEKEIRFTGKATLVTFSYEDLKPLAINIVRGIQSLWSESIPFSEQIREGVEVGNGNIYITIIGEANGKQFAISKKIEL